MAHLTCDGVRLHYDAAGAGHPAMVFVHGWTCDRSHFAPQMEYFSRDHRCVAVDLRGHGESDRPEQAYTIEGFADDVAWVCGQLQVAKPVIVGHSMGGAIALSMAVRHPALASAIVMLDGAILYPQSLRRRWPHVLETLRSRAYLEAFRTFLEGMFMPTDDVARRQRIIDGMTATPQHVVLSAFEALASFDSVGAAQQCRLPALYVGSHGPVADMAKLRALMPHVILAQTAGAGHFHQLEVPEQVNAMIERFLAITVGS